MAQDAKNSFVLYFSYKQQLALLTDEERGKLLMALFDYGESGTAPELEGMALMAFSFISSQMDRDAHKYQEIAKKRSESGKKGGRPPKQKKAKEAEESKKSNSFSDEANENKKSLNDNVNDNDNENVNGNEDGNENDNSLSPSIPQGGKESDGYDRSFAAFWDQYPKQVGKVAARQEWERIPPDVPMSIIMGGLERAKKNPEWIRENGRFIPNPSKWIRERRWNDAPPTATAAQVQPPPSGGCDTMGVLQQIIAEGEHEDQTPF